MIRIRHRRVGFFVATALMAAAIACSSSSSSPDPGTTPPGTPPATTPPSKGEGTVGSGGGKVATTDGLVTVDVPPGALPTDTNITITEIPPPIADSVGKTFEIGPTGTQFAVPVTLSFKYGGFDLAGNDTTDLEVATIANGAWVALGGQAIDTSAQIASAQTTHLSPYAIHGKGHHDDAGADATPGEDAATDSGSDASPADAAFDAAGCQVVGQQVGSCANLPFQICPTPKVFTNCTDLMPMGYSGYCCN